MYLELHAKTSSKSESTTEDENSDETKAETVGKEDGALCVSCGLSSINGCQYFATSSKLTWHNLITFYLKRAVVELVPNLMSPYSPMRRVLCLQVMTSYASHLINEC